MCSSGVAVGSRKEKSLCKQTDDKEIESNHHSATL